MLLIDLFNRLSNLLGAELGITPVTCNAVTIIFFIVMTLCTIFHNGNAKIEEVLKSNSFSLCYS